ncbi:TPA: hypothetical protein KDZ30_004607 [Vibrio alginolyticus]|nr:hypothetical protein [Vibrio alginolyticus]HBC3526046.1 hypothetical protein [Vibrio alginolyticus]
MKFKTNLLCSLVAFSASASALADSDKTYVFNLSADIQPELSVQLLDDSGNELAPSQAVAMSAYNQPAGSQSMGKVYVEMLAKGYKLQSNDTGTRFKITRTLSPLTMPAIDGYSVSGAGIFKPAAETCGESFTTAGTTVDGNQEVVHVTYAEHNDSLCSTSIEHSFNQNKVLAGQYTSTLTIHVAPDM